MQDEDENFYEVASAKKTGVGRAEYLLVLLNSQNAVAVDLINCEIEKREGQIEEIKRLGGRETAQAFGKNDELGMLSFELAGLKRKKEGIYKSCVKISAMENYAGDMPSLAKGDILSQRVVEGFFAMRDEAGNAAFSIVKDAKGRQAL